MLYSRSLNIILIAESEIKKNFRFDCSPPLRWSSILYWPKDTCEQESTTQSTCAEVGPHKSIWCIHVLIFSSARLLCRGADCNKHQSRKPGSSSGSSTRSESRCPPLTARQVACSQQRPLSSLQRNLRHQCPRVRT